jgi:pimeloyl-ACP methyl ester carboxylesterase
MAPKLDGFGMLSQIDIPVLLLRGAASDTFSEASAATALSLLPYGQLQTIADTTHFVPMEQPDAVERAVRTFIA